MVSVSATRVFVARLAGCAVFAPGPDYDALTAGMMRASFRDQGIVKVD